MSRRHRFDPRLITPVALAAVAGFAGTWGLLQEPSANVASFVSSSAACHSSYAGRCVPVGPDLDCADIGGPVRVVGPDTYRLDGDGDGTGCEW